MFRKQQMFLMYFTLSMFHMRQISNVTERQFYWVCYIPLNDVFSCMCNMLQSIVQLFCMEYTVLRPLSWKQHYSHLNLI